MIKPEIDLHISITALEVYNVAPNIINDMLSNLEKITSKQSSTNIDFAVWLTGHDKATIKQMYNDWSKRQ